MWKDMRGQDVVSLFEPRLNPIPLYTTPPAQPAPVQEPVGVFVEDDDIGHVRLIPHQQLKLKDGDKLYTTPPAAKRTWTGLTDEEIEKACVPLGAAMLSFTEVARAIEAKLKEKNL
jgi:hypothetical protein